MARTRRGGFGGIVVLLAGAWLIGLFVGDKDQPSRIETIPLSISTTSTATADADRVRPTDADRDATRPIEEAVASRWIRGSKVAFRSGPATTYAILDRFNAGREVRLLQASKEWSKVRDALTLREGWIATRLLTDKQPSARKPKIEKRETAQEPIVVPKVEISDAEIIEHIIAQSIANYSGNCPCPFNTDRAGRTCGKRSAYSRPGGASPICFVGDVTQEMIAAFRRR